MKGTVSNRMIIEEYSANIELRPLGILVGIFKGLTNFTWVIPYYQLIIYNNDCSSLYSQGRIIRFRRD